MIVDFVKEWGSLVLSCLGIFGGIWAYFHHDKQLKSQERLLNDMQIKQIENQAAKEKKAEIKANVIKNGKGAAQIRFVNVGKSDAKNVNVEILTPAEKLSGLYHNDIWGPYDMINPQSFREERVVLFNGHPHVLSIKVTWDDDYESRRTSTLSVPL